MGTRDDAIVEDWSRLAAASRKLIANRGLAKFSLRGLARESGWTIGELSYRTGNKNQLVEKLLAAENDDWSEADGNWFSLLSTAPSFENEELAAILASYVDHLASDRRLASILRYEMLVAGDLHPNIQRKMCEWVDLSQEFWDRLLSERIEEPAALARVVHAYILGELIFTIALGHVPVYRIARQICMHRLCHGILDPSGGPGGKLLESLLNAQQLSEATSTSYGERAWTMAAAAGELIMERGVTALTHRSVGDHLGISGSAVAYHFPTRSALFAAAIDALNDNARQAREVAVNHRDDRKANPADEQIGKPIYASLTRSIVIIALAASRDSELQPLARRLRLERGTHSYVENRQLGRKTGFDRWAAQLSSMVMLGASIQVAVKGGRLAEHLSSLRADLDVLAC